MGKFTFLLAQIHAKIAMFYFLPHLLYCSLFSPVHKKSCTLAFYSMLRTALCARASASALSGAGGEPTKPTTFGDWPQSSSANSNQFHHHPWRKSLNNPQQLLHWGAQAAQLNSANSSTTLQSALQICKALALMDIMSEKQSKKGEWRGTTEWQQMCQHSATSCCFCFSRAGHECRSGWRGSATDKTELQKPLPASWRTGWGDGEGGKASHRIPYKSANRHPHNREFPSYFTYEMNRTELNKIKI